MKLQEYTTYEGSTLLTNVEAVACSGPILTTIYYREGSEWRSTRVYTTPELQDFVERTPRLYFRHRNADGSITIRSGIRSRGSILDLTTGELKQIAHKWLSPSPSIAHKESKFTDLTYQDDYEVINFTKILSTLLKNRGLTQQQFAEKIGARQAQISEWLRGKNLPSYTYIRAIALALDVPGDFLLGLSKEIK